MKEFLKYTLATIVGILVLCLVASIFSFIGLVGMVATASTTTSVRDNSVLVLSLDGAMDEQSDGSPFASLVGTGENLGLSDMLSAIRKAKGNDKVKGIYIEAGDLAADMAQMQELRDALADFKQSKKWIVAYGEDYSLGAYYVSSIADKLYVNPVGSISWQGIGGQQVFLKDVLQKVGVKIIPFKCGKFKSATEMFTEEKMSAPSRQQTERYIYGWWETICQAVSKSRGISVATLNEFADLAYSLADTKTLIKGKMVDGVLYNDQVKPIVNKMLGQQADEDINQLTVADMVNAEDSRGGEQVAVYYAWGDIVDEAPTQNLASQQHFIVGNDVCEDLADLADDESVKAVVIRINSGGGSAYASEQIWRAVQQLREKKPVVVSMGGAAASGGYYMSCGANYIYAEPTTITGSIGIFGLALDRSELMTKKLGFHYDEVKTNRNAILGSVVTPMNAEQTEIMQASIDRGYHLFKSRVAAGRRLSMEAVEQRAQGHVFLGSDALKLGLVDALGGLDKAVAKAADLAKLKDYHTLSYPTPESFLDQLFELSSVRDNYLQGQLRVTLGELYDPIMMMRNFQEMDKLQARMPFILNLN